MVTAHPIIRFPVFLMGILGGLQTLGYYGKNDFTDQNLDKNLFYTILPIGGWCSNPISSSTLNSKCVKLDSDMNNEQSPTATIWRRRVDFSSIVCSLAIITLTIIRKLCDLYLPNSDTEKFLFHKMLEEQGIFHSIIQFVLVHSQLTLIIGLCKDDGYSLTSRVLRSPVLQFLGKISLSLFITHWTIIGYISLAINGIDNCGSENDISLFPGWDICAALPNWSPLLTMVVAPVVAFLITRYVERPVFSLLHT